MNEIKSMKMWSQRENMKNITITRK